MNKPRALRTPNELNRHCHLHNARARRVSNIVPMKGTSRVHNKTAPLATSLATFPHSSYWARPIGRIKLFWAHLATWARER